MTGAEHYQRAESLLEAGYTAEAQVHATLALAAATVLAASSSSSFGFGQMRDAVTAPTPE